MSAEDIENNYRIKWVRISPERKIPILLQNRNGPCPLLAISNALLLRGNIELHEDMTFVMEEQLIERITEYIFRANPSLKEGPQEIVANQQQTLADVIRTLPKLKTGIDVNTKFYSPDAFEFTPELSCFDLCHVRLLHGWLVDPDEKFATENFAKMSYNQLVDHVIVVKSEEDAPSNGGDNDDDGEKTRRKMIAEAGAAFLDQNSSQLTFHGLFALNSITKENEICVFFRNNHFMTLTKHNGDLYTLVSDLGFLNEPEIVWDKFVGIHGESQFVNSQFEAYDPFRTSDKDDLELARKLQAKEDARVTNKTTLKQQGQSANDSTADSASASDYEFAQKVQQLELKRHNQAQSSQPSRSNNSRSNSAQSSSMSRAKEKASSLCAQQ
mmetsp:Transcript_1633/g.4906  ORF Transcript_1633/g.4906 Transcript_1633/m.4906 type:complete len:384 (+) Transcript_1633:173-1324(+)|eukprot:CAMPEP_0198735864 /NCGR_PEP_ID=MMETSP1475-20131203/62199_1 /TAXON_ID= ORGANISM="Unidentified sp., Strain CCMP1999" /NCGR_SAMPLE_ID=MMETSP1475 /ASSEMBLY_ACC=CAM_ASM_001111 /LENGTH=383 /DNA_ID=CAMNT_0044499589 /DNA_START=141 /DNA_END=1292 /DNA_ORIENTATION=-